MMAEALLSESNYFCHQCTRVFGPSDELICPSCSSDFLELVSKEFYEAENLPCIADESSESDNESDQLLMSELSMETLLSRMLLDVAQNLPPEPGDESGIVSRPPEELSIDSHIPMDDYVGLLSTADEHVRNFDSDAEIDALASQLLDEINVSGPPPLSKEQIKSLPTVKIEDSVIEKELQCTVCIYDLQSNEKVKRLPCGHFYHENCITPWLEKQSTCPNCRQVIQVETESKNAKKRLKSRARMHLRSGHSRRFSEASSISEFFTTSMNPFRYIN